MEDIKDTKKTETWSWHVKYFLVSVGAFVKTGQWEPLRSSAVDWSQMMHTQKKKKKHYEAPLQEMS